jgi:predicted nucleotidyltransferase component of viral defense system
MIDQSTYTRDWVNYVSNNYGHGRKRANPMLIEKATKALHLLELLTETTLNFIFKGGTSLLLLLDKMHRFSIDIDIIVEDYRSTVDMNSILDYIVHNSNVFLRYEVQERVNTKNIPKAHYKLFYNSVVNDTEGYVLLDILFEKNSYLEIIEKDINCNLIKYKSPARVVRMPSIDCILGDKLTAYAPNTTGILYNQNKELEIIKQLFDVANLFDQMSNLRTVRSTFISIAEQELEYREIRDSLSYKDVLDDVFDTSRTLASRGIVNKDNFKLLESGVQALKSFVFSSNYIIESAINSAGKAAYLSLLLKNYIDEVERYNPKMNLKDLTMPNQPKVFKNIIKYNPEAYYYWYKSFEILENRGGIAEASIL